MSTALVSIPWQPHLWVAPATLTLLRKASSLAGRNIYLVGKDAAWRAHEVQLAYYINYLFHGGPLASNPDTGPRQHPRGAAVDIRDKADRKWMLAAGFLAEPAEWWHFNHPAWRSMPIITQNIIVAGGNITPIRDALREEDDDMAITLYYRPTGNSTPISGNSRIWAGERVLNGLGYSDVWAFNAIGEGHRLLWKVWADTKAEAARRGIDLKVYECSGNDVEAMLYAQRF